MSSEQEHFDAARRFQAYYDETLRRVGARAPQPTLGQTVNDYRRETLRTFKRTFLPEVHDLYKVNYRGLKADALQVFEPQLLEACVVEANNPVHVPAGELRKVEELDEYGKLKTIRWVGQQSFVKQMMRPGRRVTSFLFDRTALSLSRLERGRYETRSSARALDPSHAHLNVRRRGSGATFTPRGGKMGHCPLFLAGLNAHKWPVMPLRK